MESLGSLYLDRTLKRSLQAQLADQMKAAIQAGRLSAGQKLPSTRLLADQLRVSRNTVVAAYDSLYGEGYLQASERSAFIVGPATQAFRSRPQAARGICGFALRSAPPRLRRFGQPSRM